MGLGDQPDRGRACVASQRFSKCESAPSSRERGKTQSRFPAALRRTGRESERRFEPYRKPLTPKALPRAGERSSRAMGYCFVIYRFVIYRKCAIFRKSKSELRVSEPPRIEKFGGTFFSFFPLQAFEISQNGQRNPWKNLENPSDSLEIFGKSLRPACRPGRRDAFRIADGKRRPCQGERPNPPSLSPRLSPLKRRKEGARTEVSIRAPADGPFRRFSS